ncbi:MAG: hypothetical protein R3B70_22800 [Polyangiaceae bacterium]
MCAQHAAVEGFARVVLALLDEHDGVPALGELAPDDGPARAGADHDDIALDHVVAFPRGGAEDLIVVTGALRVLDALPLTALRAVDVRRVEVDELEERGEAVGRPAHHGVAIPRAEELLLACGVELVERATRGEDGRRVQQAHGLAERGDHARVEEAHGVFGAEDRALVSGGDLRGAGEDGLGEREGGAHLLGGERSRLRGGHVERDRRQLGGGGRRRRRVRRKIGRRLENLELHGGWLRCRATLGCEHALGEERRGRDPSPER